MKKHYLIAILGFLCCLNSFSFSNLEYIDDAAIPNIKVDFVEVDAVCNGTNDYTYNFKIDLCSIHTPDGNPVDFHAYIRPNSDNTWVYLGVPNLVDTNELIYEITVNTTSPFSVETWIMQGFYNYVDPSTIDPWFGYNFCASHRLFEMPEPVGDCVSSSACDCIHGGEIYNTINMCDASFNLSGFGVDGCATLIQVFTWDFGDDSPEVTTTGFPISTSHTYDENGSYTVTVSFDLQDNATGELCEVTYEVGIEITDCDELCTDEPYVEPHWELCETNNVCELESWPIRVLDDDGSPLLLLDGYTFSWSLNGTEISTSDILYGAQEDLTYTVTITYPNGCEYTITYLEICCVPEDISITANGTDITDTLTYTIPCGENCVTINATNITDGVYNTSDPVLTDLNGLFCVPPGSDITSFTANITGLDSCGDPYNQNVTVFIEQDCCLDDISVIFDECPDEELMANTAQYRASANTVVSTEDAMAAYSIVGNNPKGVKDCDPCESGVVSTTVVDSNGDPITNFVSINVSWDANPSGVNVNTNQFLVYVDVLYTVTVTVIDPDGHECVYTYDFIYECETKECDALTAPTNLQNNGSSLSWDPVLGAVEYIISSPSVIRIDCCRTGVSIAPITTTSSSYALPLSLQSKCFVWQVTAVCADGTQSLVSEQSCHLPTLRLQENADVKESITIYPNPSKGHVDIKVEFDGGSIIELDIYRYDGLLVKTIKREKFDNKTLKFDLELDLPTGLYLFNFKTKNGMTSKRVIIE